MKSLFSRLPKKLLVAVAGLSVFAGAVSVAGAWYPERPTYTIEKPAPHVTFNSITNNPNEGDERPFFEVKDATHTQTGGFSNRAEVKSGQELLLRVYVHNNAASNLNGQNYDGPGVAKNTKVRVHLPSATDSALRANAYISADNATPKEVSDTVDFVGKGKFGLEYVPGSAIAYTNAVPSGIKLNDSIVSSGAPVGYKAADGIVPGCFEYDMIVTLKVKVKMPDYSIDKQVSKAGDSNGSWVKTMNADKDDMQSWMITFKNTGSTELKNVKVVDEVPKGLEVVPGTVKLINGNYPNGYVYPDSAIQANGRQVNVDIGNYNPGGVAYVGFRTKVVLDDKECGTKKITNRAYATPNGYGAIWEEASINVDTEKECEEPEAPKYSCEMITVKKLGGRKVSVNVDTNTSGNASVKQYVYDFGDGSSELVTDKDTAEYTYDKAGTYAIRVRVDFTVDGETKTDESEDCVAKVSFDTPEVPEELPSTGAGSIVGIFAATTVAGALAHRFVESRRS